MSDKYYRVVVNGKGISQAVDELCPRGDPRRYTIPPHLWLAQVTQKYPNGTSYWTEEGIRKYKDSGLLDWHLSFIKDGQVVVLVAEKPKRIFYQDDYRVIADSSSVHLKTMILLEDFVKKIKLSV